MVGEPIAKRIASRQELSEILKAAAGYIYNGSTDAEAKALGFEAALYGKLHESSCRTLQSASHGSKTFFPRLSDADEWLAKNVGLRGKNWHLCSFCYPAKPRADVELRSEPPRKVESQLEYQRLRQEGGYVYSGLVAGQAPEGYPLGKIHDARCRMLDLSRWRRKVWFVRFADAQAWLVENVGRDGTDWRRCSVCRPAIRAGLTDPASMLKTVLGDAAVARLTAEGTSPTDRGIGAAPANASASKAAALKSETESYVSPVIEGQVVETIPGPALLERLTSLEEALHRERQDRSVLLATLASVTAASSEQPEQAKGMETAWQRAIEETYELQTRLASSESAAAVANAKVEELERALERAVEAAGHANPEAAREIALPLYQAVTTRANLTDAIRLEVLDVVIAAAGATQELSTERGLLLSGLGRDKEAQELLRPAVLNGADRGVRSAFVLSSLRLGSLPDPAELLDDTDWTSAGAQEALIGAASKLRPPDALKLAVGTALALPMSQQERLLEVIADRPLKGSEYHMLIDLWTAIDAPASGRELMRALSQGRIAIEDEWVYEAVTSVVIPRGHESDRGAAARLLVNRSTSSRNLAQLKHAMELIETHLANPSSMLLRDEVVRALVEIGSQDAIDEAAFQGCALAWRWQQAADGPRTDSIASFVKSILPRVSPELREDIRDELGALIAARVAPRAPIHILPVTSVAEALEHVTQNYPNLVVLDEARASAAAATGNLRKILEALDFLGRLSERFAEKGVDPYKELATSGFKFKADVSDTAKQKYRSDYLRRDSDGNEFLLGPHLDLGNKTTLFRIYLYIDGKRRRIVIGQIGTHLSDKSS